MDRLTASGKFQGQLVRVFLVAAILAVCLAMSPRVPANSFSSTSSTSSRVGNDLIDSDEMFSGLAVIKESELGSMRGGFRVGGLVLGIGATVRTSFDGQVALESLITLTGNGLVTRPAGSGGDAKRSGLTIIGGNGSGPSLRDLTPAGIELPGLEGSQGVVLNDGRGFTASLHRIDSNRILSTVINQASGRRIRHQVNIDVTVRNFRQFQQAVRGAALSNRLSNLR